MNFQIGDTVGPYRIVGLLGVGGMGQVFKVEHAITGRIEAMKVLLQGRAGEPGLAERFLREVRLQAGLSHPNIASVHNAFLEGNDLFMVMELVDGEPLQRLLEGGPIPWPAAIGYARQALAALAYAHASGVTHRDVKPANMIITPQGTLKLTDFGLAKAAGEDLRLTRPGAVMGSAHYMSPEQVKDVSTLDARSDLYSLGVVLYEAVTGRRPFDGAGAFDIMRAHLEQPPVPPIERDPGLPRLLSDAILTALAKKPEDRFPSAEVFRQALERVESDPGPASRAEAPLEPLDAAATRPWQSRVLWIAGGAAAALAAVLVSLPKRTPLAAPQPVVASPAAMPAPLAPVTTTPARASKKPKPVRPASPDEPADPAPAMPVPRVVTIAAGTELKVRTTLTLSTGTHQVGETFFAVLEEPLMAGGIRIAAQGAMVEGRIEDSGRGGRFKGRASLAVRLIRLHGVDGDVIPLATEVISLQGGGRRLPLVRRGAPALLPADTLLSFHLAAPVTVTESRPGG